MSEPVSNAEIEDVLSSIRRLVSENAGNARERASESAPSEKLVLTPAFRVLTGAEADVPKDRQEEQAREAVSEAPAEEVAEAPMEQADWQDMSAQEPQVQDDPVVHFEPVSDQNIETQEESPAGLEQTIAELEAAIEGTFEEWEPDGSEEETDSAEPIIIQQATPAHYDVVEDAEEKDVVEGSAEDVTEIPAEEEVADELEKVEAQTQPEPDEAEELADDAGYLDEEALRELVIQLVREELQGHVGQRITRSVRRMVRREIKRVMALHELE